MTMNMNNLVISLSTSLGGFFEFCEVQNGVKADDLLSLFNQYFEIDANATHPAQNIKKAPKKPPSSQAPKKEVRKPSGKNTTTKSRDEHTPINNIDLNKKKLPELKDYARERGIPVSGTKAQLIENLLAYENKHHDHDHDQDLSDVSEEDLAIKIIKPKGKKLCEPANKPKYDVEMRHGVNMIHYPKLDGYFVLNDKDVVVGWVHSDDEADVDEDEAVPIRELNKKLCEMAKELKLEFDVPEHLDI